LPFCGTASYTGTYDRRGVKQSGASFDFDPLNVTGEIMNETYSYLLEVDDLCLSATHGSLGELESCDITIGDEPCECKVCD
jgi:hypothetical protein